MKFSTVASIDKRIKSDLLVIPFYQGEKPEAAAKISPLDSELEAALSSGDFSAKEAEVLVTYTKSDKDKRVALIGLGKKDQATVETFRKAFGAAIKAAISRKASSLNIVLPEGVSEDELYGIAEGLLLANYAYDELKGKGEENSKLVDKCSLIGISASGLKRVKKAALVAEGVYLARNLINGNADEINPQKLADTAKEIAKQHSAMKATVFDKKRIQKEKMGLLLAVNRGSSVDPAFIILEYTGNPRSKDKTVIVGKGITYDTGGLNLKPTGSMETMKSDMSGAAVVLGIMQAIANVGLNKNVTM